MQRDPRKPGFQARIYLVFNIG